MTLKHHVCGPLAIVILVIVAALVMIRMRGMTERVRGLEQEVRVLLSGEGEKREFTASEIRFGKGRKIWTALLEAKGIWHAFDAPASIAGKITPPGSQPRQERPSTQKVNDIARRLPASTAATSTGPP